MAEPSLLQIDQMRSEVLRYMLANDSSIDSPEEVRKAREYVRNLDPDVLAAVSQTIHKEPLKARMFSDAPEARVPTAQEIMAEAQRTGGGGTGGRVSAPFSMQGRPPEEGERPGTLRLPPGPGATLPQDVAAAIPPLIGRTAELAGAAVTGLGDAAGAAGAFNERVTANTPSVWQRGTRPSTPRHVYDIAREMGFDEEGARVAQAVAVVEAGMGGAVGDRDRSAIGSHGPFQFYGPRGQLDNYAKDLGVDLSAAGERARSDPEGAIRWALSGYLGNAIRRGQQRELHGAELATFVQQTGQVSEHPERAGAAFDRLGAGLGAGGIGPPAPAAPAAPVSPSARFEELRAEVVIDPSKLAEFLQTARELRAANPKASFEVDEAVQATLSMMATYDRIAGKTTPEERERLDQGWSNYALSLRSANRADATDARNSLIQMAGLDLNERKFQQDLKEYEDKQTDQALSNALAMAGVTGFYGDEPTYARQRNTELDARSDAKDKAQLAREFTTAVSNAIDQLYGAERAATAESRTAAKYRVSRDTEYVPGREPTSPWAAVYAKAGMPWEPQRTADLPDWVDPMEAYRAYEQRVLASLREHPGNSGNSFFGLYGGT